ncbi:MAG: hypothetical protein M3383_02425 [Actinomycetota bacterium]|nr:hypothetical protein [Actinomycetota bacterium]
MSEPTAERGILEILEEKAGGDEAELERLVAEAFFEDSIYAARHFIAISRGATDRIIVDEPTVTPPPR